MIKTFRGLDTSALDSGGSFMYMPEVAGINVNQRIFRGGNRFVLGNNVLQGNMNNKNTQFATSGQNQRVYKTVVQSPVNDTAAGGTQSKFYNIAGLGD